MIYVDVLADVSKDLEASFFTDYGIVTKEDDIYRD
jgi:hypothetical protein